MNLVSAVTGYFSPKPKDSGVMEVTPDDNSLPESRSGTESSETNRAPVTKNEKSFLVIATRYMVKLVT